MKVWLVEQTPGACFTAGTTVTHAYGRDPIESLAAYRRLLTEGTQADADQFGDDPTDIDVASSRLVTLRMPNSQCPSDVIEMKLVRPVGLLRDAGWEAGAVRPMKIAELGIEGLATIVSVEPCPAIQPGRGRVITGTITHLNGQLLQVKLRGLDKPIEVTEPHRFYSEDRLDWVAAKELKVGERLRRRGGAVAVVESVTKLPGVYRVYNVEVEGEQQYFVSNFDVLVHNIYNGPQSAADLPPDELRMLLLASAAREETTYCTYTKTNYVTGEVYAGRTSGTGDPIEIVAARDVDHHMNDYGFGPAVLDESSSNYAAIRGREQQLIWLNGGAKVEGGTSGNWYNGIREDNPNMSRYLTTAELEFGFPR